jgi:2-dehydro-3-deoxy-D-arabinonate dehydratase
LRNAFEPRGWRVVRFRGPDRAPRVGAVDPQAPATVVELASPDPLDAIRLGGLAERASAATRSIEALDPETLALPPPWELLEPLVAVETWAAGVTYERSRQARVAETQVEDVYSRVYGAERPELFLKDAAGRRTVGPGATVGVRADSHWTVPEPELALVLGEQGALLGATIGNDLTARDIEGENPLYLPQAKLFAGACAIGPAIVVPDDWGEPFAIEIRIVDASGDSVYEGLTSTDRMKRTLEELVYYLGRDNPVPAGTLLLTGTGLVPPDDVALAPGHSVEIRIAGIGMLRNPVGSAAELIERKDLLHVG